MVTDVIEGGSGWVVMTGREESIFQEATRPNWQHHSRDNEKYLDALD